MACITIRQGHAKDMSIAQPATAHSNRENGYTSTPEGSRLSSRYALSALLYREEGASDGQAIQPPAGQDVAGAAGTRRGTRPTGDSRHGLS